MNADRGAALRWGLLLVTVYVVHIGVAIDLDLFGVHPELMLLVAVAAGLSAGPARGAEVGFAAGLLSDLVLTGHLGTSALAFALVGFGVGAAGESVIRSSRAISVGLAAGASAVGVLLYAALAQLLGQRALADPRLWTIVGIVALANAALSLPIVALGRWAEVGRLRSGAF